MDKRKVIKIEDQKVMMDYIDVRDELRGMLQQYEKLLKTLRTPPERYIASRKAVALMEACNLITRFLRHPDEFADADNSGIETDSEE